jgi:hypothetical protein
MFNSTHICHSLWPPAKAMGCEWVFAGEKTYRFSVNLSRNLRFFGGADGARRAGLLIGFFDQGFPEKWAIGRCELCPL